MPSSFMPKRWLLRLNQLLDLFLREDVAGRRSLDKRIEAGGAVDAVVDTASLGDSARVK